MWRTEDRLHREGCGALRVEATIGGALWRLKTPRRPRISAPAAAAPRQNLRQLQDMPMRLIGLSDQNALNSSISSSSGRANFCSISR
ncbi:protein of unknown function (plasmid) [Methylocella tundrae]|uniref:Uncharacterized protein n=1 Tax=Methylocella tundrae TaxID=227605 RepID=A0A4U8Z7A5_METTU|nr:protein of unknown function [Methylocella tundrae]